MQAAPHQGRLPRIPRFTLNALCSRQIHTDEDVQCDETRPKCLQCKSSERNCEYAQFSPIFSQGQPARRAVSKTASRSSRSQSPAPAVADDSSSVNMLHARLFHHLSTQTVKSTAVINEEAYPELWEYSLSAPFLMNQLLSLSALHLSILQPQQRNYYHHHATQLQTHALASFNSLPAENVEDMCVPRFLFASALGFHLLCETLVYRESDDLGVFIDRFVHSSRLHHGVRAIAAGGFWNSTLKGVVQRMSKYETPLSQPDIVLQTPFKEFVEHLQQASVGHSDKHISVYTHASQALQAIAHGLQTRTDGSGIDLLLSWTAIIDPEYINLLSGRQPEALVILAHYGALLHTRQHMWMIGDAGAYLMDSIPRYLGPTWEKWLRWPIGILRDEIRIS